MKDTAASLAPRPDLLEAIVGATRNAVDAAQVRRPRQQLEREARHRTPRGDLFRDALVRRDRVAVIAECKRRSPSRGVLRHDYNPTVIATGYDAAGAAAISVLTEPTFFDGALDHLTEVRSEVKVPILRKDFIVSGYQLVEAWAAGADAVLLIVAALSDDDLRALLSGCEGLGLAAVVEVHDEPELTRAGAAGADIIGVNNRNLRTLDVDLDASFRLVGKIPDTSVAIAESGIRSSDDLQTLRAAGYDACLVGESLMTRPDPGAWLRSMLHETTPGERPRRRGD